MKNKIPNLVKASAFMLALIIPFLLIVSCPGESGSNKEKLFTVAKGASNNGTFTVSPEKAKEGDIITLQPFPSTGYRFDKWDIVPPQTVTPQNDGTYAFLMPGEKVTVNAEFVSETDTNYSITKGIPENGTFTIEPSNLKAEEGDTVTLKPTPNKGYEFDKWDIVPSQTVTLQSNGTYTFKMPAENVSVNAVFKVGTGSGATYNITRGTYANGNFSINPTLLKAAEGDTVTLTPIITNVEYVFDSFVTEPDREITDMGNGSFSFIMPAEDVKVNAIFNVITYTITKGTHANGDFTIDPAELKAAKGDIITLEPTAESGYYFNSFTVVPAQAITDEGGGIYTFEMPNAAVTINAAFFKEAVAGTGTKTLSVVGGIGKVPIWSSPEGSEHSDATRHFSVTVTMNNGTITDVTLDHTVTFLRPVAPNNGWDDWYYGNTYGPGTFVTQAENLANAIKTSGNPDVVFARPTALHANNNGAWDAHEAAIRQAVKDAVAAINAGKPNRELLGGGTGTTPWTADGVPLSGDETITGMGFMSGGNQPSGANNFPTDIQVRVKVEDGFITVVQLVSGGDLNCTYTGLANMRTNVPTNVVRDNTWLAVDALSQATISRTAYRNLIEFAVKKMANEY